MWQADAAQQARIKALVESFEVEIPALFDLSGPAELDDGQRLFERLETRFGTEFLDQAMPEFLVFPDVHDLPRYFVSYEPRERLAQIALSVADGWVARRGGAYAIGLLAGRLRHLLANLESDPEIFMPEIGRFRSRGICHTLHVEGAARLLARHRDRPEALAPLEDLLLGRWDGPISLPYRTEKRRYAIFAEELGRALRPDREDESAEPAAEGSRSCIERLYMAGRLDYEGFKQVFRHLPCATPSELIDYAPERIAGLPRFHQRIHEFFLRLVWDAAQEWNDENIQLTNSFCYLLRRGGRWLIKACEHTEALGLATLSGNEYTDDHKAALRRLAGVVALDPDEDAEVLAGQLARFDKKTLFAVLPMAKAGEESVLRALGWGDEARQLLDWIRATARARPEHSSLAEAPDIPNSSNPASGVIDREQLLALLKVVDSERCKQLVAAYRGAKVLENTLTLLEAAAGWNRKKVEAAVIKHGQIALKAYGLLPLERGEAEVLERYLLLKRVAKEASKHGAERQANTRAAVQGGLANLAQTAGYPDLTRLEWAMESRVADEGAPLDRRETLADWEVELTLDGLAPRLQVFKQGKPLKSVPAGLKKVERFLAFQETHANFKAQVSRFRATLEGMMAEGDLVTPDDLGNLIRIPAAVRLLQGLILRTETGEYGTFDPPEHRLMGLGGTAIPLDGAVRIAHPYHLLRDGLLPDWQREVVRRRIVQPFKQAFREIYVLTPAEEETGDFSNRFAGHALRPSVTSRLLQGRGWQMLSASVFKRFRKAGLIAEFDFPDAGHYLSEGDSLTSDQIRFRAGAAGTIPLRDVPPLIFSEVMRDADLVVSVAQLHESDELWSAESYQRRAELVATLVDDLGLPGVRCEGHFAYVTGRRANYRVHLGSAAIHIEPGNYLCIVPARAGAKEGDDLFLPFADAEPKTCEVISKILLLANDEQIKDKSILDQIAAAVTSR